jgi:hypothetical protein
MGFDFLTGLDTRASYRADFKLQGASRVRRMSGGNSTQGRNDAERKTGGIE